MNVWTDEDLGCVAEGVIIALEAHNTAVLLVQDGYGSMVDRMKRSYFYS